MTEVPRCLRYQRESYEDNILIDTQPGFFGTDGDGNWEKDPEALEDRSWEDIMRESEAVFRRLGIVSHDLRGMAEEPERYPGRETVDQAMWCVRWMYEYVCGLADSIQEYREDHMEDWI